VFETAYPLLKVVSKIAHVDISWNAWICEYSTGSRNKWCKTSAKWRFRQKVDYQ